jgi:ketosteroid isomerase-like protein
MVAALAKGKAILSSEHYELTRFVAAGDSAAAQVAWTGVLAVPIGALKAGDTMRTFSGMFFRFAEGRIVEQHNYDCFEDFLTPRA